MLVESSQHHAEQHEADDDRERSEVDIEFQNLPHSDTRTLGELSQCVPRHKIAATAEHRLVKPDGAWNDRQDCRQNCRSIRKRYEVRSRVHRPPHENVLIEPYIDEIQVPL